jgi:hypothetical protein
MTRFHRLQVSPLDMYKEVNTGTNLPAQARVQARGNLLMQRADIANEKIFPD